MENLKIWFKKGLSDDGEEVSLNIKVSDEIKKLLKKSVIDEETSFNLGEKEYIRYKVKKVVYSSLYQNNKDILFIKELVDNGECEVCLESMDYSEDCIINIKDNLQRLIKGLLTTEVEQQITFKIRE